MLLVLHLATAVAFFLLINWLGRNATAFGYYSPSVVAAVDDAPAFNLAFRVLTPVVLLIIVAAAATAAGWVEYAQSAWRVTLLLFGIRWAFNAVLGRLRLLHWPRQLLIASTATALSYFSLRNPRALLPDPATLGNELWVVIILFAYALLNHSNLLQTPDQEERRKAYIHGAYRNARRRHHDTIHEAAPSRAITSLAYAVIIYESFNRPPLFQWIERSITRLVKRPVTQGPMQVMSATRISSTESVRLGTTKLLTAALELRQAQDPEFQVHTDPIAANGALDQYVQSMSVWRARQFLSEVCRTYNVRSDYAETVLDIHDVIVEQSPFWRRHRHEDSEGA